MHLWNSKLMKYLFGGLFALITSALIPSITYAATVDVQTFSSDIVYSRDFDVLVLDFALTADATANTLNALTISPNGSARVNFEYSTLSLWKEASIDGFQGWGIDELIAVGQFNGSVWVFDDISIDLTDEATRFYVSLESGISPENSIVEFSLSPQKDTNTNGSYDSGDTGLFFSNPESVTFLGGKSMSTTTVFRDNLGDVKPPKGYISNMVAPPEEMTYYALPSGKLTISGIARDRGGNSVSSVVLIVNDVEIPAQSVTNQYQEWTATYTPDDDYEVLAIAVEITDTASQTFTTPVYRAVIDTRTVDTSRTLFTRSKAVIEPTNNDISALSLVVLNADGEPLPNREVTFITTRNQDNLSHLEAVTNEDGLATVNLTSSLAGNAIVKALIDSQEIASTSVLVQEEGVADLPAEPAELPNGLFVGDLIKGSLSAVYYLDQNGERHVFVNDRIYRSWYGSDFSSVKTISDSLLATIPLGDPVSFRPGTLLTAPSINEVYIVDINRTLRHIGSEQVAKELYGDQWNTMIHDLEESLLFAYNFGSIINTSTDINLSELESLSVTINSEIVS